MSTTTTDTIAAPAADVHVGAFVCLDTPRLCPTCRGWGRVQDPHDPWHADACVACEASGLAAVPHPRSVWWSVEGVDRDRVGRVCGMWVTLDDATPRYMPVRDGQWVTIR